MLLQAQNFRNGCRAVFAPGPRTAYKKHAAFVLGYGLAGSPPAGEHSISEGYGVATCYCSTNGSDPFRLQADLTSLQTRHFSRIAQSIGSTAWQRSAGGYRQGVAASAQQARYVPVLNSLPCDCLRTKLKFSSQPVVAGASLSRPVKTRPPKLTRLLRQYLVTDLQALYHI